MNRTRANLCTHISRYRQVNIKIEIHTVQSSCQILSSNITTPHALGWADGNQTQCFCNNVFEKPENLKITGKNRKNLEET